MAWLRDLYHKYRRGILYLFFGGLTTAVNYVVYIVCCRFLPVTATAIPNTIAWAAAVLFAYLTNRIWVFASKAVTHADRFRELMAFAGARIFTLVLETVILWVAVDAMQLNNYIVKLAANMFVVVLNYFLSRFWVFR